MEVDPTAGLPLSRDLELAIRPSYTQVAARVRAMGSPPSVPMYGWAGIKG